MDVSTLTRLEQDIVTQVRAARPYILAPSAPRTPSPVAQVRADVLREFMLGGLTETVNGAQRVVSPGAVGLQVRGVWIDGDLDLADARCEEGALPALVLESCLIPGVIHLANAHLSRLSLAGSRIVALEASGLRVEGDVDLSGVTSAEDGANATGAEVDGARVPRCQVRLAGARVGGELRAAGAKLAAAASADLDGYALDCPNLTLGADIMAQPGLAAIGGLRLRGARIGGQVWLEAAQLRGQGESRALHGYGVEIRGQVYAAGIEAHGAFNLSGARIEGELFMPGGRLQDGADFTGARVGGKINMTGCRIANGVTAPGAHFGGDVDLGDVIVEADGDGDCIYMPGVALSGSLKLAGARLGRAPAAAGETVSEPAAEAQFAHEPDAPPAVPAPRYAICAANAVIRQNAEIGLSASCGVIDFSGATIGGAMRIHCQSLSGQDEVLNARDIDVERSVTLSGRYDGAVNFERARIRGEFSIAGLTLSAAARRPPQLSLRDAHLNGVLQVRAGGARDAKAAKDDPIEVLRARATRARCYPGWWVVEVVCRRGDGEASRLVLWDGDRDVVLTDGVSAVVHDFNDGNIGRSGRGRPRMAIDTAEALSFYVKFFGAAVWGDEGAFRVLSSGRGKNAAGQIRTERAKPRVVQTLSGLPGERAGKVSALVSYGGALFNAVFLVEEVGSISMEDDTPVFEEQLDAPKIVYDADGGWRALREAPGAPRTTVNLPPPFESDWRDLDVKERAKIEAAWRLYIAPEIDLSGLNCAAFEDADGTNWGQDLKFLLEGVSFERFASEILQAPSVSGLAAGMDQRSAPKAQWSAAAGARRRTAHDSAEARLKWLSRQSAYGEDWSPQPHEAFAQAYRRHGHVTNSNRVLADKAKRDIDKHFPGVWRSVRALYRGFMRVFWGGGFQYGLSPLRALGTCVFFLLVGWLGVEAANNGRPAPFINFDDGRDRSALVIDSTPVQGVAAANGGDIALGMQPTDQPPVTDVPCGHAITPWIYAADVFIPLLDLRQESACSVRGDGWAAVWRWLKALYAALGWVVISLSILTWSGALRRQTGA